MASIYLFKTAIRYQVSPEFIGSRNGVNCQESASTGPVNLKVVPNESCLGQVTMDQLICTSLPHTHYWHEVGILEVPYVCPIVTSCSLLSRVQDVGTLQYILKVKIIRKGLLP